jgi:hypothetical protein
VDVVSVERADEYDAALLLLSGRPHCSLFFNSMSGVSPPVTVKKTSARLTLFGLANVTSASETHPRHHEERIPIPSSDTIQLNLVDGSINKERQRQ